jgi:hypothetical protein
MIASKTRLIAAAALTTAMFAGAAHAGDVNWSIGIQAPIGAGAAIGTVISNRHVLPVVVTPPVVYAPPPVVYAPPAPVYAPPPRVVYAPPPVVYAPPVYVPRRVVMAPVWLHGRWVYPQPPRRHHDDRDGRDGWHDGRGHWDDDRRGPPVYQPHGGRRG